MFRGITKRWMLNTLSVILTIIILIVVTLIFVVTYLFQSGVEQRLASTGNELSIVFSGFQSPGSTEFTSAARDYIENFDKKENMGVMVLNSTGKVVLTSTGFLPEEDEKFTDFDAAEANEDGYAFWRGTLLSGEAAMSETRVIKDPDGAVVGAIRYIVSMEPVNSRIILSAVIIIAIGLVILGLVIISGLLFIRSIVKPIQRLSEAAGQIAQGDFSASEKIEHKYDDEIGDLCDAVSDMAKDLETTEQMKNDFISRVSHELRTPLTAIKGWAETMQLSERGTLDRRTFDKGMGVIIKESTRLTGIVEEGKHLLYDEPEVVYPPIYGDRNRLRQVFLNILDNALKYTPKGGVVAAQVIYSKDEPDIIKIIVTDTGCGISAEDLPRVKEKFYKANQTVRGSGIGLAVADEIMNLHHGSLDIESGEGVGTTVTLTFPIYKEGSENKKTEVVKL